MKWLADQMGENRQNVWNWMKGIREPQDPTVWNRMATILGLANFQNSEVLETARELALDVLVLSDNTDLKQRAANLIREISKKSAP